MQSEENFDRLNRYYGIFFIIMAAVSLAFAFHHRGLGQREAAWFLLAGALYLGAIGLWAITGAIFRREREDDDDDGGPGPDRPVPIVPVPSHGLAPPRVYLVAAKELPAGEGVPGLVMYYSGDTGTLVRGEEQRKERTGICGTLPNRTITFAVRLSPNKGICACGEGRERPV